MKTALLCLLLAAGCASARPAREAKLPPVRGTVVVVDADSAPIEDPAVQLQRR